LLGSVNGSPRCITLRANQVVCGLALAILGIGLSSFIRRPIIGGEISSMAHGAPWAKPVVPKRRRTRGEHLVPEGQFTHG